jgi:hypothetical protein
MKTYFSEIIPKIQRFSKKLDNLTLLTNQHWVAIDSINSTKTVYIFRPNNDLLISSNGIVEKAKWEYLGSNSILIDRKNESYLFKHGFFDENILALKIDGKSEYAFLVNETRFENELNTFESVAEFLNRLYLTPEIKKELNIEDFKPKNILNSKDKVFIIKEGELTVRTESDDLNYKRMKVWLNGFEINNGKYKLGFLHYLIVKNGFGEFSSSPFE